MDLKKKVVNFSFNDIPKFEKTNNNNNNKIKKSIDINPKLIKPLGSTHHDIFNKKLKILTASNLNEENSLKNHKEDIFQKGNLLKDGFPLKKIKSIPSLKSLTDTTNINKKTKSNNISIYNKVQVKRNKENNKDKLYDKKTMNSLSVSTQNMKNKINNKIKEINANISNINLNSLEQNENIINNENRLSTITSRLKQLEQQLSITMKELQEKNNIIYDLRKELKEKDRLLKSTDDEKILTIQKKYELCQKKLEKALSILKQNNIVINHDNDDNENDENSSSKSLSIQDGEINDTNDINNNSSKQIINKFPYDFDHLSKQIKFLNHLADDGIGKIIQHKNGAYTIQMPEPQTLNVYSNGFIFQDEFYSFSKRNSLLFIKELIDGYFPFQLKERYPEGVPFKLIDNHTKYYNSRPPYLPYTGKGVMNRPSSSSMSSEKSDSSLLKSNNLNKNYIHKDDEENLSNVSNMHNNKNVNKDVKLLETTKKNFLNNLPKNIIKDGYVIDIRKSTNDILFNDDNNKKNDYKPFDKNKKDMIEFDIKEENLIESEDNNLKIDKHNKSYLFDDVNENKNVKERDESIIVNNNNDTNSKESVHSENLYIENEKTTTIKIKNNSNEYIFNMKYTDTIKNLKDLIEDKLFIKRDSFKLKMPFQINDFEDNETLEDSSLVPNACLYIEIL
ncbi:hypothetical protein H8356DRAFT_1311109 [Neocallimastix lanati (nom. inval.)]|nr:hypothetical protein H8356DRAFT_1311109 [Neocallimastix sp. JGI-2020a]